MSPAGAATDWVNHVNRAIATLAIWSAAGLSIKGIRRTSAIPIVVFSALDQSTEVRRAIDAGATAFVLKSSGLTELVARVHTLLGGGPNRTEGVKANQETTELKILILEPDIDTSRVVEKQIVSLGHEARVIRANHRGAIDTDVDIVVLDYSMPRRLGIDLVEAMCQERPDQSLGLIIASRSNPADLRRRLRRALLLDFIEKPWQSWEVPARLATALALFSRRTRAA